MVGRVGDLDRHASRAEIRFNLFRSRRGVWSVCVCECVCADGGFSQRVAKYTLGKVLFVFATGLLGDSGWLHMPVLMRALKSAGST